VNGSATPEIVAVRVSADALKNIRKGHPWIFENSIESISGEAQAGDIAVVFDSRKRFAAVGLFDPFSMIRIRILQQGVPAQIDEEWFKNKMNHSFNARLGYISDNTTGYRLVYGENDGLPGLIVDRYGDNIVIKIYSLCWIIHLETIKELIVQIINPEKIVLRISENCLKKKESLNGFEDGAVIYGDKIIAPVVFCENGIFFESDLQKGQKTGFFLDQRDNRSRVEKLAKGKNVLNVFSYSGGFSLYAARGGAESVTSVDISCYAVEAVSKNIALNGNDKNITFCKYRNLTGDAFEIMEGLYKSGETFGMVIVDPPSFAKAEKHKKNALKAYRSLVKSGVRLLEKGGYFVVASCSSRISSFEFEKVVCETASSMTQNFKIIDITGHPPDHPVTFPEGSYLKCIFIKLG